MRTVGILASKGGVGKTSLAHCLAYGAALNGENAVMVHTDQRPPVRAERPYDTLNASANYAQAAEVIRSRQEDDGLLVIDGAGNRPHVDLWVMQSVDLVLVPVTNSSEDVRCALSDISRFADQRVFLLINRWPSNALVRAVMQRYVDRLPSSRILGRLPEVGAVRLFLEDEAWRTPPTRVGNLARRLYRLVNSALIRLPTSVPASDEGPLITSAG